MPYDYHPSPQKTLSDPPKPPPETSSAINGENLNPNPENPINHAVISSRPTSTARSQLFSPPHPLRRLHRRTPPPQPQISPKLDLPSPTGTTP
ncbi:hypothetical protein ES288_D08G029900v1 [Gossypium darwinii]|uniref:Uncharacterized protein n=1 Tax=Gossypium darwinii TaxID=34276 RepID=A0A5D2BFA2_GOSDA|nr:hypothetical protein ES288_D08G029900v1 [Gossypium darwinii]